MRAREQPQTRKPLPGDVRSESNRQNLSNPTPATRCKLAAVPDTTTARQGASPYRFDLDGLRGFAIALVVIFHVFVGRVSGGVDVFLLLSGYFFLGSQVRYALRDGASLNLWWPLWRTIRRIVPALALVVCLTAILVVIFAPSVMNLELARQFTASMLYYQNWQLMSQDAAYAAASVDVSPLQHLWSMSVQGQFYLFGIVLGGIVAVAVVKLGVAPRTARIAVAIVLALLTVASFAWSARFGLIGEPTNYYSTFSRAWELLLGALLALLPQTVSVPPKYSGLTAGLGVAMIAVTGVVITDTFAFPGPLALLPLGGATLVILSSPDNPVSGLLQSPFFQWLGSKAYALYLWHWPLLIIVTVLGGYDTPPALIGVGVIAVSLLLAQLTHTFVEEPFRQHSPRPTVSDRPVAAARASLRTAPGAARAVGGAVIALMTAAVLAVLPVWNHRVSAAAEPLDPEMYPGAAAVLGAETPNAPLKPDLEFIGGIFPPMGENCMIYREQGPEDFADGSDCVLGDPEAETTIVLSGGSHVEPLSIPLDELGRKHGFRVVLFVRQQCPIMLGDSSGEVTSPECDEWAANAFGRIVELNPDLVISTSTRPAGGAGDAVETQDFVPPGYQGFWEGLSEHDIPFLGLRDNPWIFDGLGDPMDPNQCLLAGEAFEDCGIARSAIYANSDPAAPLLDESRKQYSADTSDWYCTGSFCPPAIGNVYIYRDQNHISNAYAASLSPLLWAEIQAVLDAQSIPYAP